MRSSRQDTERHREAIIDAAARLVREKGFDAVSIPLLMAEIGMTHGGFYRHFASKEALAPLALARAFQDGVGLADTASANNPDDPDGALTELVATYLSTDHRDNPGAGCSSSALAGDMARQDADNPLRKAYESGVSDMVDAIEKLSGPKSPQSHEKALLTLSTMIGALLLSRATRGSTISDEFLAAARDGIIEGR
ncbi:MAG: putative transcriptional regulator, TetR family [Hyphomicrobiales bacterium]|nr:putative transcriptional regulator, TetR family [Hyphomicrobiales bacterium]